MYVCVCVLSRKKNQNCAPFKTKIKNDPCCSKKRCRIRMGSNKRKWNKKALTLSYINIKTNTSNAYVNLLIPGDVIFFFCNRSSKRALAIVLYWINGICGKFDWQRKRQNEVQFEYGRKTKWKYTELLKERETERESNGKIKLQEGTDRHTCIQLSMNLQCA